MAFVLDASLTMSWCFLDEKTPNTQGLLAVLRKSYARVPALWPLEVANILAMSERRQRIDALESDVFLSTLASLDIRVEAPESDTAESLLRLTRRYKLTAYDASYLKLAIRQDLPLATLDKDLIKAASLAGVATLGESRVYLT